MFNKRPDIENCINVKSVYLYCRLTFIQKEVKSVKSAIYTVKFKSAITKYRILVRVQFVNEIH